MFLPGEFHGQGSLAGYSPLGHKKSDTTEATEHTHTKIFLISIDDAIIPNAGKFSWVQNHTGHSRIVVFSLMFVAYPSLLPAGLPPTGLSQEGCFS